MKIDNSTFKISAKDISTLVTTRIPVADAQRADSLNALQSVRTAKSSSQQREQKRLTKKYGEGDARVMAMSAKISADQQVQSMIGVEIAHTSMAAPAADPAAWTLYGFVRDTSAKGVAGVTVALFDDTGAWLRQYKYVCTDDNGYFSLRVDKIATGANAVTTAIIHVLDANKQQLFVDSSPVNIVADATLFREITIGDNPVTCTPPDGGGTIEMKKKAG